MEKIQILWTDDEIDLLKPHIIFLNAKGYNVITANNGNDALDLLNHHTFDIVLLDENMPGLSGLETLVRIKNDFPNLPVVMVTKSEEESIMEEAIGSKISDYLIKPVNPNQLLLCLKKNLEHKRLISEKTIHAYQQEFRSIGMTLNEDLDHKGWRELYKKLTYWELELENSSDDGMKDIFAMQKKEANALFARFYEKNYRNWLHSQGDNYPTLSHTLFKNKILNHLDDSQSTFLIVIDNLRYDQWCVLKPTFEEFLRIQNEELYYAIIPTATQYARNALFAGLMPSMIEKMYPKMWINEEIEGNKNDFEHDLLKEQLKRLGKGNLKTSYHKVLNYTFGKRLAEQIANLMQNMLNVIVYNFVDMLAHSRTDTDIVRELAEDEAAYRSLTVSWFNHSPLLEIIKTATEKKAKIIVTTDHGSIRVEQPLKVIGDRNTNTNIRYKQGKNLSYDSKDVFEIKNPPDFFLPKQHLSTSFIFARNNDFFAYPNNYNHYVSYYKDTFQHGGISLEEVLIPIVVLLPK